MTALKEFDRLESLGLWRESAEAQRRDVVVSFGEASLVIKDQTDTALAHWSLPAIHRLNPGSRPALFSPGPDTAEELELDDQTMIDAIEKVRKTVDRRRPHHGRLRLAVAGGILAALIAVGLFWLPDAMRRHTVGVVPDSTRTAIGTALLGHMTRLTGDTCRAGLGAEALSRLKGRVLQDEIRTLYVVPDLGSRMSLVLPGKLMILDRTVIEDHDSAEAVAGFMLHAHAEATANDPLALLLAESPAKASFGLLTTGRLEDDAIKAYASTLLKSVEPTAEARQLIPYFVEARVPSSAYAYALDVSGEDTIDLIEADPYRGAQAPRLLSDGDWVSLQALCSE